MGNFFSLNLNSLNTIKKINFEELQKAVMQKEVIINVLSENNQNCLINGTISINEETIIINELLNLNKSTKIIIYGKNNQDINIFNKYFQLTNLGFNNIFIYIGGIFEWLLLQEIYGDDQFPTTSQELDILIYK